MCGRYVVAYDPQTLVSGFSLTRIAPFPPRFNVAPMSAVPVVYETRDGERVGELMRWGLLPSWAKEPALAAKLNNARAETVADKPSFRQAFKRRRCLLPASGYYEWQAAQPAPGRPKRAARSSGADATVALGPTLIKQPWYITPNVNDGALPLFAMAGLFEAWRTPGAGEQAPWLLTTCIITTDANAALTPIHDRMPVMIEREHWARWLARGQQDGGALQDLLHAAPDAEVQAHPVSRAVNRGSAEGPELILPITLTDPHT